MKRLYFIAFLCLSLTQIKGQAPQALNYQAVARTADGVIIPSQNIGVRFSILDGSVTGAVLYVETHQTTTNSYGLFTLAIGKGTPNTSTFSNINWASGTEKFLKVEIAPAGGTNYQLQGTTQLLSVPYALYSEKTRLIAGPGININGNTISNSLWAPDANGIHSQNKNVGIGTNSNSIIPLHVKQPNTGIGNGIAWFESDDVWHSSIRLFNNTSNQAYAFVVGGTTNTEVKPKNFGLYNGNLVKWSMIVDGNNNNVGFGSPSIVTLLPKSTIHVLTGDVNIEQIGSGIIMKSPNGQCWRITIDNSGNLVSTAISCL